MNIIVPLFKYNVTERTAEVVKYPYIKVVPSEHLVCFILLVTRSVSLSHTHTLSHSTFSLTNRLNINKQSLDSVISVRVIPTSEGGV